VISAVRRSEQAVTNGMRKLGGPEVFRITGARAGLTDDVRGRQRRYVISMSIRTVSVILTVVLWNVERPLAWVTLVLGAVLPYVAVVFANAGRENAPSLPSSYIPPTVRPALEPSRVDPAAENAPHAGAEPPADPATRPGPSSGARPVAETGPPAGSATVTDPAPAAGARPAAEQAEPVGRPMAESTAEPVVDRPPVH
jgi:hypothetical protein